MAESIYPVPQEWAEGALVDAARYDAMYRRSVEDPEGFWREAAQRIDWITPFTRVKYTSFDEADFGISWFCDGTLNISANALDRHLAERGDATAILWEPDSPEEAHRVITYRELHADVCRFANLLKAQGVKRGERVTLYLPMVPEAAVASPSTPQNAVKTLAVAFFENRTGEAGLDWLSKGVPDMLISYLSYSEYLQVVGIEKLQDVMRSLEDQDPAVERNPAFEVARLTQAEILVMGSVVKSGGSIRIIASIYETNQARLIKTEYVEGRGDDQLFSLIDELSGKIKLALEIEASGEKPSEDLSRIKTNSLSAYKAYMEGLDRLYEYNDQEAISSFQKAIQIDPAFGHAYLSLARTYDVLGENSLAREAMERAMTHSGNLPKVEKAIFKLAQDELNGDWEALEDFIKRLQVKFQGI